MRRVVRTARPGRLLVVAGIAFAALVAGSFTPAAAPAPTDFAPAVAVKKKRCRIVVRKIHRKKRRVRVCRKARPAKPPAPPSEPIDLTATIAVAPNPLAIAVGEGAVWIAHQGGVVSRVDPATNQVAATIPLPASGATSITVGAGAVWVTVTAAGTTSLYRLDPATNAIVETIALGPSTGVDGSVVRVGEGAVWVATGGGSLVARVDPQTSAITRVPASPETQPSGIAFGGGFVWVVAQPGTVYKVDPHTTTIAAAIDFDGGPPGRAADGEGSVWISDRIPGSDRILRYDPQTGAAQTIRGCSEPWAFVAGGGFLWATTHPGNRICAVNPVTNTVAFLIVVPGAGATSLIQELAFAGRSLWVPIMDAGKVLRYDLR
jgi:streptogramin lyase